MPNSNPAEHKVLVVQGGGALGAYQAGAYAQLSQASHEPAWVAGISIGSINAALICGNPPERRVERLRQFWERVSSSLTLQPWFQGAWLRTVYNEMAAEAVVLAGVPGFFRPKLAVPSFMGSRQAPGASYYDTSPLRATLMELVDFDFLNKKGPRLSVGAVEVATGNFVYFDSAKEEIGPEHIMASGALPPGFPAVRIGGKDYWDGGLVSNTPLQYVFDTAKSAPLCIFQIDLFSARGMVPKTVIEAGQREKDIRFSSRTRLTTDRYIELHHLRAAADRLVAKLPEGLRSDPDLKVLQNVGPSGPITLVHLIHRKENHEGQSKDYEFSRLSMEEHWASGVKDVRRTLAHPAWKKRKVGQEGLQVFDLGETSDASVHVEGVA